MKPRQLKLSARDSKKRKDSDLNMRLSRRDKDKKPKKRLRGKE